MKYAVITFMGGSKEVILQEDFFKMDRSFDNVSIRIKEVPKEISVMSRDPDPINRVSIKDALFHLENYGTPSKRKA